MIPFKPVMSAESLRGRVDRLLKGGPERRVNVDQVEMFVEGLSNPFDRALPYSSAPDFLDFLSALVPEGDVYIFGGLLRDISLYGKRGFNSDIDVVVEGEWFLVSDYLRRMGAKQNKFGGFRVTVDGWPIDIWSAQETWAIKRGFVSYVGISSLLDTTILNWDSILMNWRTKSFIHKESYFPDLRDRRLDVVLLQNPNPCGMAVRVFRHLCSKDAHKVSARAMEYLCSVTREFSLQRLVSAELGSYGRSVIEPAIYRFFEELSVFERDELREAAEFVGVEMKEEGYMLTSTQFHLNIFT